MKKEKQLNNAEKLEFIREYCELPSLEAATQATIQHVYSILKDHEDYLKGNDSNV